MFTLVPLDHVSSSTNNDSCHFKVVVVFVIYTTMKTTVFNVKKLFESAVECSEVCTEKCSGLFFTHFEDYFGFWG